MGSVRAEPRERFAVWGPVKITDELRGKVCYLSPLGSIERLNPEVAGAMLPV